MSEHFADWDERTLDLAIDRFTVGLDLRDDAQLDRMAGGDDLREFEHALAAIHLSSLVDLEQPPAEFLGRLERAGRQHLTPSASSPELPPRRIHSISSRALAVGGWLVAAGLLLALLQFPRERSDDVRSLRAALIVDASDLVRVEWAASQDPSAADAVGDVVWSPALQQGYMRFRNLAPNDPRESQYQLWIFDPTRADWEAKPVDGGVFDVSTAGEVVVPIEAKLAVGQAALFAVTLEAPRGVVVSERERLVLTAAI